MLTNSSLRVVVATTTLALVVSPGAAFAGRGGGGGGGGGRSFGGGGGGGAHFGGGGMAHPSFSTPRPSFSGGGFNRPAESFRPSTPAAGNFNRTNVQSNNFNRANVQNNNLNRTNVQNNAVNRTNVQSNNFNRTNVGVNNVNSNRVVNNTVINRSAGVSNNYTRVNSINGGGFAGYGNRWPGRTPYWGYHQGWVNGAWNSHYYPAWGYGYGYGNGLGAFGLGLAAGGLMGFGMGASLSNWGYSSFNNPYYYSSPATMIVQQPVVVSQQPSMVYNYSQPINTTAPPPDQGVAQAAIATFDAAREAFKNGDYASALSQVDSALISMPNDPTLHEFRALVLFAQRQYDAAAATLYPVLAAGPGWDWTTLVGLYPNVETYTAQLRALEDESRANPNKVSDHFVLAYHYLTEGFPDNAASELRDVTRLQPTDTLSARLLAQISKPATANPGAGAGDTPPPPPTAAVAAAANPNAPRYGLTGSWTAQPNPDTTITFSINADGNFEWTVTDKGGPRKLAGGSTYGNDILTLAPSTGDPLVGRITWADATHFNFQAAGGGGADPGLSFQKTGG